MVSALKWETPVNRSTGITSSTMAAGANLLSNEIVDSSNRNRFLNLELTWTCAVAATENLATEVYLLYALDGANYEDGGTSVDPKKTPVAFFVDNGGTGAQKQAVNGIAVRPFKFKILLKSELDQEATSVALDAETHNEESQ